MDVKVRNIEEVQTFLKSLPRGTLRVGLDALSTYILGNDQHGLKHYPPKKNQKYVRTFKLKGGWVIKGDDYRKNITNPVPYTKYVPRWKKYGWREWADVIMSNMEGAKRHALAEVKKWIKENKPKG